ncbi:MAG: hypothetical protein WCI23_10525 [Chlorobiaceae bacterium]
MERAVILSEDTVVHADDLPLSLQTPVLFTTVTQKNLTAKLDTIAYEMAGY